MKTTIKLGEYRGWSYEQIVEHIVNDFQVGKQMVNNYLILLANYNSYDYDEDAFFVLLDKNNGKLFIVDASHCSCYGFEEQFTPDETGIEYLLSEKAHFGGQVSEKDKENIQQRMVILSRYLKLEQLKERMG